MPEVCSCRTVVFFRLILALGAEFVSIWPHKHRRITIVSTELKLSLVEINYFLQKRVPNSLKPDLLAIAPAAKQS